MDPADMTRKDDYGALYPSTTALNYITNFAGSPHELFEFIKPLWASSEIKITHNLDRQFYEVDMVTFGWSGNEKIITALKKSCFVMSRLWYSSTAGGRHVYRVPAQLWDTDIVLVGTVDDILGKDAREDAIKRISELDMEDSVKTRAVEVVSKLITRNTPVEEIRPYSAELLFIRWNIGGVQIYVSVSPRRFAWTIMERDERSTGTGTFLPTETLSEWLAKSYRNRKVL